MSNVLEEIMRRAPECVTFSFHNEFYHLSYCPSTGPRVMQATDSLGTFLKQAKEILKTIQHKEEVVENRAVNEACVEKFANENDVQIQIKYYCHPCSEYFSGNPTVDVTLTLGIKEFQRQFRYVNEDHQRDELMFEAAAWIRGLDGQ